MSGRRLAPTDVRIGGKYLFEPVDPRPAINTGRVSQPIFAEVLGFGTFPNGQRAIRIQEWRDGRKDPDGCPALSDLAHHWRVTEIEQP